MSFNWAGKKPKKVKCTLCRKKVLESETDELAYEIINEDNGTPEKSVFGYICYDCGDKLDEMDSINSIIHKDG